MSVLLNARTANTYGAEVCADSLDGLVGRRGARVVRIDSMSAARTAARRRVKRNERQAVRAEIAAEIAAGIDVD